MDIWVVLSHLLAYHFQDDLICISIWHQSRQRPASSHSKPARVIDNDEVASPFLYAFSREPNTYVNISFR